MSYSRTAYISRNTYEKNFYPAAYLKEYTKDCHQELESLFTSLTHKAFSEGMVSGPRCIDVGSGPLVHRLATASKFCDILYAADFIKPNRDTVDKFLNSTSIDPLQRHLIKFAARVEGFENVDEGCDCIEARLRSKLRGAIPCDILSSLPVGDIEELGGRFDVAISASCLETACTNYTEFKKALVNLAFMLRSGGSLILKTHLNEDQYEFDGVLYPCIKLSQDNVLNGLKKAGFQITHSERIPDGRDFSQKMCSCDALLFVVAELVKKDPPNCFTGVRL